MTWLILTILLAVLGVAGLLTGISASVVTTRISGFSVTGAAILVWLILTVALSVHGVGQRQIGIVYNFAGVIAGKRDPGIVWTAPWQHIKTENVGIQHEEFHLDQGNSAVSFDQQPIFADIALNFQVLPQDIIDLYSRVGPSWKETLLDSRVLQNFKEVTATFSAAKITTKRGALRRQTRKRLELELARYDIKVVDFFVRNIGYTEAYNNAVTAKTVQKQKALQAQAKVQQSIFEGQQILEKARRTAKANSLRARSLTPAVLTQNAIDKLNDKVTVIYCQQGIICVPNAPSLTPVPSGKG